MSAVPLDELVPHRPPMRFLDRVVAVSESEITAETIVSKGNPMFVPGRGLPAYAGLEMMAQAVAAIDGMKRRAGGMPPKIGFLLGTRRYRVSCTEFAEGMCLAVSAKMVFSDGAMMTFECRIDDSDGVAIADASMNVYAPADPEAFLKGSPA